MADPFQPKFVDLVRNFTTTTGTGNIVPGAAVAGFRSLSGAVATGDRFFYCVLGIDKPAEREVGRGTMMADGTVGRQPIGGPLTNFSSGTKTIALVVAAEWFDTLREWIGGSAGNLTGLATSDKSSLVAAVNELAGGSGLTFASASGAVIAAAVTDIETNGYATAGRGAARYVYDAAVNAAYVTANPREAFLAADSRGFRLDPEQHITAQMFGAVADGATDDRAALQAWLDHGGRLYLPAGHYFSSQRLIVRKLVLLSGDGYGHDSRLASLNANPGSRIRFPAGQGGILVQGQTTETDTNTVNSNLALYLTQAGSAFSVIANIGLLGGGAAGATGTGFEARARMFARNVRVLNFGGKGFDFQGSADISDPNADYGSVSLSNLENCYATGNGSHGFHVRGRDASVVNLINCDAIDNGGFGFYDQSIFGGSYANCHAANNIAGSYKATSIVGSITYLNCYVEGGAGQACDVPMTHQISGGTLALAPNINVYPAPTQFGVTRQGLGTYWRGANSSGEYYYAGFGATTNDKTFPVAFSFGAEAVTGLVSQAAIPQIELAHSESDKDWHWQQRNRGTIQRLPSSRGIYSRQLAPGFDGGLHLGARNRLFVGVCSDGLTIPEGSYSVGDLLINGAAAAGGKAFKICVSAGVKATTAWSTSFIGYVLHSAPYAAYYVTNAGKVFKLVSATTLGVAASAAPTHASGTVVGADGYGWQFVNATGVPLFKDAGAIDA